MRLAVKETETEDLFAILANKSPVGLYIVQDGKFCYTNPTFQSTTGYTEDELLGMDALELVVLEDRERVRENAIKMLKGDIASPYQFRVIHKTGSIKWVIESVVSIQYCGRRATLGNFIDITERKQAEEELQTEKNKLQSLIDALEYTLTIQDTEYNIIYQNEPSKIASGGDHLGEKCYRAYEGRETVCDGCPVKKAFKDGKSHTSERRTAIAEKAAFWENTASPIRDAEGRIVACLELARDITKHKQAEEALQAEKNKLQSLVDAMEDNLTIQDRDYNLIYMPERVKKLWGAHTGDKCYRAFEGQEKICDGCPAEEAFKDGKSHIAERRTVLPSGEVAIWENRANPIRDAAGRIVACLEVSRNITERKKQEQALADELTRRRLLVDQSLDGIVVLDVDARVVEANQRFAEMLGYTLEEVRELHTWDWDKNFPPEKLLEMGREIGEKGLRLETKHTRKDGSVIDVDISISAAMFGDQKLIFCVCRDVTERKRMEEALRDSEEKLRKMFESVTDGISVIDLKGIITEVNQRMVEMHGFSSKDELRGKSAFDLVTPRDHKRIAANMKKTIKQEAIRRAECTLLRADSSEFLGELSTSVLKDASGNLVGHVTIARDITERKKMEEALNLQRAYFQQLFDNSPDAIIMIDMNDRIIQANKGFEMLFGYSAEEVKGQSLREVFIPEEDAQVALASTQRVLSGEAIRRESMRRRKDGSLVDVSILSYPIRSNGGLAGAYLIYTDITKRKEAEEAIKHAAEEWRMTFDSITDAISIHDRDFRIQRANKAFANIFRMKPRQLIGRHCYELHRGAKPISGCPHKQTLVTGKPAVAEFYESNLGKYLLESTSPIFDKTGEVIGTIHITREITEQKQQNEQLMITDRLASIGELAAGTAHELNNPLTSVIGFSQLVLEKDIPDDIREDMKLIYNEAQRAANVTKNLLTFARKHAPVKQLNQINNIIEDVLKLRAYEHKANCIEVKKQLASDLPEIRVDYFQMQQVFLNIIINAEYFMTEAHKRGTLTITTKKQNDNIKISITDDGPSIPPENLSRIFDPFFTTKAAGKGTGLGLSICHGIVSEHGGQIYARSQRGKGATIIVELPINNSVTTSEDAIKPANTNEKSIL
jgi:PAS domain S-box-containing protein